MNKKLVADAIQKQIKTIAFDANLYDRGLADYPYAKRCSQKRKKLVAELNEIEGKTKDKNQPEKSLTTRDKQIIMDL